MGDLIHLYEFDERDRDFGDSFLVTEPIPFPRRKPSAALQWLGLGFIGIGWCIRRAYAGVKAW